MAEVQQGILVLRDATGSYYLLDRETLENARVAAQYTPELDALFPPGEVSGFDGTQMSFNLQYLMLQSQMQNENRAYTAVSNIMKTKHNTVRNSISNIR